MNFSSIDIQGSILSAEQLGKIRAEQATFQQGKDFNPAYNNSKVKDEISLAWQDTKAQWTIFNNKLKRLKDSDTGATETRQFWVIPLLASLGYDFQFLKSAEEINGKSFWINFREQNIGGFPLFIAGYNESLDKRPENKSLRVSPHALVQEYLNYSEHLYGIVTNGKQLRLLRDASRLTRLSYLEFNLEKIMEEDLYSDFVILYRLLHVSRMPLTVDGGAESIIEKYHQEGLEAGATIRDNLGKAVKGTIESLALGFINHPENTSLRDLIIKGNFNGEEYYRQMLRIIYRILYLFVIEERNLVYAESKEKSTKRFNQIYFNHYSLLRLRKLAKRIAPPDASHHYDLWMSLISTFELFEKNETGKKMGLMSLQGDLFNYNAIAGRDYDLHQCHLGNDVVMKAIKALGYFENDKKILIAVNYGGLDVEEFGSVYEGLLELKLKIEPIPGSDKFTCSLTSSSERSKSGSHYTPEELVQPLIKYSLQYIIDERKAKPDAEQQLLNIKVCDVACGSGHILLSAARKIALELACIRETNAGNSNEKVEQPSPLYLRHAMRDVIRNCIYGVDKNPLAVELCKVALWLEAHNPNEPLNFLDHHIKCGDAIVGLAHREELENGIADESFKTLPGDEKEISSAYSKQNKQERKARESKGAGIQLTTNEEVNNTVQESLDEYKRFNQLPERTPEEIESKKLVYKKVLGCKGFTFLKAMADSQVAQFFIPKTTANKGKLITDNEYRQILAGQKGWQGQKTAMATAVAQQERIFNWFLEFPEVFQQGGFDCVLGNPPFLGGQKLSGAFGNRFLEYIKYAYNPIGAVDLVTYFFRRIFNLLNPNGFQSLISTNTIAQGSSREGGLDIICSQGGSINHAVRSMRWPGQAAVEVSLVTIHKKQWKGDFILDTKKVDRITPYLDDSEVIGNPFPLKANAGKSFIGSYVLGMGFVLTPEKAKELISKNSRNKDVLFPYLNGDDLNTDPEQKPSRWVINFFDWTEEKARSYPDCFEIIERLVKPERQRWEMDKNGNEIIGTYALRKPLPQKWWIYGEKRPALYRTISKLDQVMILPRVSKYFQVSIATNNNMVFSEATVVIASDSYYDYGVLSSLLHEIWAWKNSSTMKGDALRYSASKAFETFPFPTLPSAEINKLGKLLLSARNILMRKGQLGLTEIQNRIHNPSLATADILYDELLAIRNIHRDLDNAVLDVYGWNDIILNHNFYPIEYLPEKDRTRFTVQIEARKEILTRLMALNREKYNSEIQSLAENVVKKLKQTAYKEIDLFSNNRNSID
jgi:type I restriction-modification system DNA methylase subunit